MLLQPIAHKFGVEPAFYLANKPVANFEANRVCHIAAIRHDDDVTWLDDHASVRGAFIWKGVNMAHAPLVHSTGFVCISVLAHHRVFTAHDREISSGVADDLHQLGVGEPSVGVQDGLFQSRWSQELFKIIRVVDCEYHTCPGRTYPLNPPCEKSPMQTYQQIRGLPSSNYSAGINRRCDRAQPRSFIIGISPTTVARTMGIGRGLDLSKRVFAKPAGTACDEASEFF